MNINKKTALLLGLGAISFVVSGCGSSGGDSSSTPSSVTQEGVFVDAPVQGLKYKTATHEGFTGTEGTYSYEPGEEIEFFLGTLSLGKVTAQDLVTPYTLAGDDDLDSPSVLTTNIAQILQSLDDTADTGHIVIPQSLSTLVLGDIDLNQNIDADLQEILNLAGAETGKTYTLVDETQANINLKEGVEEALPDTSTTLSWEDIPFFGSLDLKIPTGIYAQDQVKYLFSNDQISAGNDVWTYEDFDKDTNTLVPYESTDEFTLINGLWEPRQAEGSKAYTISSDGTILSFTDEGLELKLLSSQDISGTEYEISSFEGLKVAFPSGAMEYKLASRNTAEKHILIDNYMPSFQVEDNGYIAAIESWGDSISLNNARSMIPVGDVNASEGDLVDWNDRSIVVGSWNLIQLPSQATQSMKLVVTNPNYKDLTAIDRGVDYWFLSVYTDSIYVGEHSVVMNEFIQDNVNEFVGNEIAMTALKNAFIAHDFSLAPSYTNGFTSEWLEGRILYQVITDTQDDDNDGDTTDLLLVASKFENGMHSLDFSADGSFEVTNETYTTSDRILSIIDQDSDLETYEAFHILNTFIEAQTSTGIIQFFYDKAEAQKHLN